MFCWNLFVILVVQTVCGVVGMMSNVYNSLFEPNDYELTKAVSLHHSHSWGHQASKENSYRILAVGCGNMSISHMSPGILHILDEYLQHNLSSNSFLSNSGISNANIESMTKQPFEFEQWDVERWPNIVLLLPDSDGDVNFGYPFQQVKILDKLIHTLNKKYATAGAKEIPDVLIFEMFNVEYLYNMSEVDKTVEARRQRLDSLSVNFHDNHKSGFNRGSIQNMYVNEFASFYGYPVLSFGDVAFPSFVRHFTSSGVPYSTDPWSYSTDGSHLTLKGCHFVVDKIFGPFLHRVREHHRTMSDAKMSEMSDNMNSTYGFDLHMFQPEIVQKVVEIAKYTASVTASSSAVSTSKTTGTNTNSGNQTLQSIAKMNKDFSFISTLRFTDGHTCFDSTKKSGNALFEFIAPPSCSVPTTPCSVSLTSYHSTDTQIGNTKCTLYFLSQQAQKVLSVTDIQGSQIDTESDKKYSQDHGAVPIETLINKEVGAGKYMLRCVNVEDDKHTCISEVTLRQLVNEV